MIEKRQFQPIIVLILCLVLSCSGKRLLGRPIHAAAGSNKPCTPLLSSSSSAAAAAVTTAASLCLSLAIPFCIHPLPSYAVDPSELRQYAGADAKLGTKQGNIADELKKYKETQDVLDMAEVPFTELPSGVSYREYREGKGSRVVQKGSTIEVEMSIRCKSLTTGSEPQGVKYYSTKTDTPTNSLVWTIGNGDLLPGLEEAMMGMKRNAIRRIEIPSVQVFAARDNKQLPLPAENNEDGQRRFRNLFKTKADLLVEVLVNSIKDPVLAVDAAATATATVVE